VTHLLVTLVAFRDALDAMAAEVTARLDGHAPDSLLPLEGSAPAGPLTVVRRFDLANPTSYTTQDAPPPVNDAGGTGEVHPHEPDPTETTPLHVPA